MVSPLEGKRAVLATHAPPWKGQVDVEGRMGMSGAVGRRAAR
ncbi:hypothetical protein [Myxococcus stipitatus]|nr:hypothetical protein [Myxococcus stipitatus]